MNAWIRQGRWGKGLFALLLLFVLAVRVAAPAGFMPTKSAHGIVISLCTGHGAVKMVLPVERHDDGKQEAKDGPCLFAAVSGGALLTPSLPPLIIATLAVSSIPIGRAIAHLTVHRLAAPPPPSQAPPAHG